MAAIRKNKNLPGKMENNLKLSKRNREKEAEEKRARKNAKRARDHKHLINVHLRNKSDTSKND